MTAFDPYATLDVARTATPAEIRAAYRRKAKRAHPDAGGDRAAFESLSRAARPLESPEARARFDRTGHAEDEADNADAEARGLIGALLEQIFVQNEAPELHDFVAKMRELLTRERLKIKLEIAKLRRRIASAAKASKRLGAKPGDELLRKMLAAQSAHWSRAAEGGDAEVAKFDRALALIEGARATPEAAAPVGLVPFVNGAPPGWFATG